ncbi:MAG TPA: ATP-dependent DNA helicase RecG [Candidatus Dormibacteraeota bacterium]|nr:ATP-dependent DNA helicase RecG [Candidatus Dormibacteraeota bacterium]
MAEPAGAPSTGDALAEFLAAVRRPLDYLAAAGATAAARTQVAGRQLAARGRQLRGAVDGERRQALDALCQRLERLEAAAAADERTALAAECRALAATVAGQGGRDIEPEYRRSGDDVAATLERLRLPVQFAKEVGPRRGEQLRKFGLETVEDLLYHLPFRYEDRRRMRDIASVQIGEEAGIVGEIVQIAERTVGRNRRKILEGVLRDASGLLALVWYHHVTYYAARYRSGIRCRVYGRVDRSAAGGKRIVHPEIELAPDSEANAGIVPVYEKPTTMTVSAIRKIAQRAAADFADAVPRVIPPGIIAQARIADPGIALRALHAPAPDADVDRLNRFASQAHRALVFDELFFLQLGLGLKRRQIALETGLPLTAGGPLSKRLTTALPFKLTGAQRRVIAEIYRDLARSHPMHRLVQGDVGSGKTVVALFAALAAIEQGFQAAFMAPTELLAEQHHRTLSQLAEPLGVRVALLTGEAARGKRGPLRAALESGEVQLAVGTHALIQAGVRMPALALGVIDEQHRFGVLQRAALAQLRGDPTGPLPHILLMTATPIPRTLAMTIYSDLDVSLLDELPPGRKPVRTHIVNEASRKLLYDRVKEHLARGRQAYIVYPLVEASEKEDLRDATTMCAALRETVFKGSGTRVGLLHGRMKADEKDAVMRRFRDGDLHVLVTTTVVEVGVDVPNATVMVIEHAERFGLSQLHQLRGRVGRGSDDAICLLVAPYVGDRESDIYRRLKAMATTSDGFRIAEVDLELRGPGDFLGTRQHGLPDFRVASLIRDTRTLAEAREAAEKWLTLDPHLRSPESAPLRQVLEHRWKGRLGLAEIG